MTEKIQVYCLWISHLCHYASKLICKNVYFRIKYNKAKIKKRYKETIYSKTHWKIAFRPILYGQFKIIKLQITLESPRFLICLRITSEPSTFSPCWPKLIHANYTRSCLEWDKMPRSFTRFLQHLTWKSWWTGLAYP